MYSKHVGIGEVAIKSVIPRVGEVFTTIPLVYKPKSVQQGTITMECILTNVGDDDGMGETKKQQLHSWEVGSVVEVNYNGQGEYFPGKIGRDLGDGTFDINYDDGDLELKVKAVHIRRVGGGVKVEEKQPNVVTVTTAAPIPATAAAAKVMSLRIQKLQIRDAVNTGNSFDPQDLAVRIKVEDKTQQTER
jgi:hypothetical protein